MISISRKSDTQNAGWANELILNLQYEEDKLEVDHNWEQVREVHNRSGVGEHSCQDQIIQQEMQIIKWGG